MQADESKQGGKNSLFQRAEKAARLPLEEFQKIPASDTQNLMHELCHVALDLEKRVEQLQQTQAELTESRKLGTELFDFAPVGYFILDKQGIVSRVNITASDMLNISRGKLIDVPFISLVEPHYHDAFRSYLRIITDTGYRSSTEIEMKRGDGTTFHAQLQTVAMYEKSNIVFRVSVADITERKRVEKALSESEQKYRDLADLFPEIIFETDTKGNITYANRKALAAFGYNLRDLSQGINIFNNIAPEDKKVAMERFAMVLEQGDIGADEYTLLRRDGTKFPSLSHTARIMQEGKVVGMRGIAIDITKLKEAEKAMRESEKRLRTTLDAMLEGCQIIDFNWRYVYVNDAVAKQGRRDKEELLGHTMMEMYPGIENTEMFNRLRNCMQNRVPHQMDNEFTFLDGSKGWFELRIQPVPEGILILSLDITERKLAEQHLKTGTG